MPLLDSQQELTGKAYTSAQRTLGSLGWVLREEGEQGENVGKSLGVGADSLTDSINPSLFSSTLEKKTRLRVSGKTPGRILNSKESLILREGKGRKGFKQGTTTKSVSGKSLYSDTSIRFLFFSDRTCLICLHRCVVEGRR